MLLNIGRRHGMIVSSAGPPAEAFRDSVDAPPVGWKGTWFKMCYDYPKLMPTCDAPWLKRPVSFSNSNCVKQGQDPNLPDDVRWQPKVNNETRWFRVPYSRWWRSG
jgi:hypothetical protein